jgi:GNAT superfamily N-acetyltransferase
MHDLEQIVEWNIRLAEESEGKRLSAEVLRPGVAAALADANKARYYIAECDGRPVGQVMTTYEWSDWRNGWLWWIQSVYVESDFRRRGVYRALHANLREEARRQGDVVGFRLYVEKDNHKAHRTYEGTGMVAPGYFVYEDIFAARIED